MFLGLAGQLRPELELHALCKVCLGPGKGQQKQHSRVVKRARDAVFNEEFFFDNIGPDELTIKTLNIRVCHHSGKQFQKDVVIGDIDVPLKDITELQSKKEVKLVEELKPKINVKVRIVSSVVLLGLHEGALSGATRERGTGGEALSNCGADSSASH